MRIDKVVPTAEEQKRLTEIRQEQNEILDNLGDMRADRNRRVREDGEDPSPLDAEMNKKAQHLTELDKEANSILAGMEARYIKTHSKAEILADAKEIVDAVTREDFLGYINFRKNVFSDFTPVEEVPEGLERQHEEAKQFSETLLKYTQENYENCYLFIMWGLRVQYNAFNDDPDGIEELDALVAKKVSQWYENPTPTHFPVPYSKPTDALAFITPKKATIDKISGDATIDRSNVHLKITGYNKMNASLGISTDKLLNTALGIFAKYNDFGGRAKTASKRQVVISLKEYAKLLGYDVEEHITSTEKEAEREKKRAKAQLDNARKKTKKDLDILYNISFEWEEIIRGKLESFSSTRLLSSVEYRGGNIYLTFTPEIADHLISRGLLNQYNTKMLAIDERHYNAYRICRKLEQHYNMDINRQNNRHDRIGIETILAVTDLPSYEEVQATDRGHWERRIKDPLEENLDYLTQGDFLESWEYTHAKGVPLTDEEAQNIASYEDYSKLYLHFTPANKVDHTERVEAKAERIETKKKKASKKKS